jgi:hypothetical protein
VETRRTLPAVIVTLVILCIAEPGACGVITIDRTVNPADVLLTRDVLLDLSPLPGQTFLDTASITDGTAVMLTGGDTLNVRVALHDPLRFAVNPSVASVIPLFGGPGAVRFALKLQNSATSLNLRNTGFAGPSLSLLIPENATLPSPSGDGAAASFESDAATGQVLSLTAGVMVLGTHFFVDPTRPSFFTGFQASLTLPVDMPQTTFDRGATLSISASLRAQDPPPPLLSIVPEPVGALGLLLLVSLLVGRRVARSRASIGA